MSVIEHGSWEMYKPATLPPGAPGAALFARRVTDGVDWYNYVQSSVNFRSDTIKMTVLSNLVCAAVTDPARLFPGNALVLEVTDVPLDNPQGDWGRRVYDPATQTFSADPLPIDTTPGTDFEARIAALEAKYGGS